MCCRNKARRTGGCCSRHSNNNNNNNNNNNSVPSTSPLRAVQPSAMKYERRPGLLDMFAQHIAQKRHAKKQQHQQQQFTNYQNQPKEVAFVDERNVDEEKKMMEERQAQATWDEKRNVGGDNGVGVDHVQSQSWIGAEGYEYQGDSMVSAETELPSYGQAVKQQ